MFSRYAFAGLFLLLIASVAGTALVVARQLNSVIPAWLGFGTPPLIQDMEWSAVGDARGFLSHLLREQSDTLHEFLLLLYAAMIVRILVRRAWLAAGLGFAICWVLLAAFGRMDAGHLETLGVSVALGVAGILWLMFRFGLLSVIVTVMVTHLLRLPITPDLSQWYSGYGLFAVAIVLAVATFGLYTCTQGRPVAWAGHLER